MREAGPLAAADVAQHLRRLVGRDDRREDRQREEDPEQHQADLRRALGQDAAQRVAPQAGGLLGAQRLGGDGGHESLILGSRNP